MKEIKGRKAIIWGASIGGGQAYNLMAGNDVRPYAFCDNSEEKQKGLYQGLEVLSPLKVKELVNGREAEYVIIIASTFYGVIYEQIQKLGIRCDVLIFLLYDPCKWKKKQEYTENEKRTIRALYDTNDNYTNDLLNLILEKGFLNGHHFGKIEDFFYLGGVDAYFYDNISRIITEPSLELIDIGAYTGDSILQISNVFQNRLSRIYAFEPDPDNYKQIEEKKIDHIKLYKIGLGDSRRKQFFSEEGPFFRASEKRTDKLIEVETLDHMNLQIQDKVILKMDVEGMELNVLKGAENFIKRYMPYIAVCVYHKERDILDIPQYLKQIVPEYSCCLRGGMHTVCYAFPQDK